MYGLSPLWLILRLWLAWKWIEAGWAKVQNPAWTGPNCRRRRSQGFVQGAVKKATGEHPDVPGWYASFLQNVVQPNAKLWSNLVAYGELLVGIALVLGIFTGIAAFFGAFMNFNYLLSGTVSTNPMMFLVAGLLVLAWKTAGWLGVDRVLLPALGTPWAPGECSGRNARWRRRSQSRTEPKSSSLRLKDAHRMTSPLHGAVDVRTRRLGSPAGDALRAGVQNLFEAPEAVRCAEWYNVPDAALRSATQISLLEANSCLPQPTARAAAACSVERHLSSSRC